CQRVVAAARARDLEAVALQVEEDEVADVQLVLDDEHAARHVAAILPAARLPQLQDPGALEPHRAAGGLGEHARGRLVERLVREIEGAPVDAEQSPTPEV